MRPIFRWAVLLAVCLLGASVIPARAASDWEQTLRDTEAARASMNQAMGTIGNAENAAQQALRKVETADHFEGPQWSELEKAQREYADTFRQQVKVIDASVQKLLKLNPSADIPPMDFSPPQFKSTIKAMEAVRDDLKRTVLKGQRFKAERQSDHAKVTLEMEKRTDEQYTDVALNLAGIPMGSDGSINYGDIVASLLPGPAGTINTVVSLSFGLYYFADEMRSGAMQIKTFEDQIAYADRAIVASEANLRSAEQGLQFLNSYWAQKEEVMKEFYAVRNAWTRSASQSRQDMKKEESAEFQQEVGRPHYEPVNRNFAPPLLASEAEPEARGIIAELQSAALAAMQGGDPDNYASIQAARIRDYLAKVTMATASFNQAIARSDAARPALYEALNAANAAYWQSLQGHCSCERAYISAVGATYEAAQRAAWAAYEPYMAAVRTAERELSRLWMVRNLLEAGAQGLAGQIRDFGTAATNGLQREYAQSLNTMAEARVDLDALSAALPYREVADGVENYTNQLESSVRRRLGEGADPAALRSELRANAESFRALGEKVRVTLPEYRRVALAVQQIGRDLASSLNANLDRDAMLIAGVWDSSLYNLQQSFWSEPWQRASDGRKESIATFRRSVDENFKVTERTDLTRIASVNYEGAAQKIEQLAGDLEAIQARIATFNYRLAGVSGRLDRLSRTLTNQPLYKPRAKSYQALADEELLAGAWADLSAAVDAAQAKAKPVRDIAARFMPLTPRGPGIRPRLVLAESVLLVASQSQMRNFIEARSSGAFQPVRPDDFKELEAQWLTLKPLLVQFDALAAAQRPPLLATQKEFPDTTSLQQAYEAIPAFQRPLVDGNFGRYKAEAAYLETYVRAKLAEMEPVGDPSRNDTVRRLDEWIGGYPLAFKNWETQQAASQALFERQMAAQRQRAEAEEKARRDALEQENQAAQAAIESVRKLYQEFVATYQARNLRGVLRFMTPDWRAADGSDLRDLEDILDNSFRVFNRIVFAMSGLNVQALGQGRFNVSYSATITGHINQMNLKHQETAQVEDTVILTPFGPRIQATRGGRIWLKQ